MAWIGRDPKVHPVPSPLSKQGHLPENCGCFLSKDSPVRFFLHIPALLYLHVLGQASWLHGDDVLVGAELPSDHFVVVKLELDPHSWRHIHFGFKVFHIQGIAPEKSAVGLFLRKYKDKEKLLCTLV